MKIIKKTILITLALLITNGCSGLLNNEEQGHFMSQVSLNNTKLNQTVTRDMLTFIQDYYPISKTIFYFQLTSSAYAHDAVIEDALRNVGYGISYIKKRGRIPFAYKIDFIDEDIMRTTYNIGSSTLSRLYKIEANQAKPISAFTTRGFKKRIYQNYSNQSNGSIKKAIVTVSVLNARNKPSSKGKITRKYHKNSLVYVESPRLNTKGEEWSRVVEKDIYNNNVTSNTQNEYISSRYIKYLN